MSRKQAGEGRRRPGRALAVAATISLVVGGSLLAGSLVWQSAASEQLAEETSRLEAAEQEVRSSTVALGEVNQRVSVQKDQLKETRRQALRSLDEASKMADAAKAVIQAHREMAKLEMKSDQALLRGDIDESNAYIVSFDILVDLSNSMLEEMWEHSAKVLPVTGAGGVDA